MKAITLSLLTVALALGVTATWAKDIAATQQARIQQAKEIVAGKHAAYTGMTNLITERKAPFCEKADAVAAERTEAAKDACRQKCDTLRGENAAPTCPMREKSDVVQGAREKAPVQPGDCCK
jgi:hypothetical protein